MRLSKFRKLSPKRQKQETEKAIEGINKAYLKLCQIGVWNKNATKELRETGEAVLWTAKNF